MTRLLRKRTSSLHMTSLDYALPYISITEPAPDNLMARKMKMATQESQDEAFY